MGLETCGSSSLPDGGDRTSHRFDHLRRKERTGKRSCPLEQRSANQKINSAVTVDA
jgi:hypothetical protein